MRATVETVRVGGLRIAYREQGDGPAVLLLHGWPTSSYLWRDVMAPIARASRVIAVDLPGYGASDKPLDVTYDFAFFDRVLDGFLAELGIDRVGLAVHDLGGPIGLHWAVRRPGRLSRLALLNTLLYPSFTPAVAEFVRTLRDPARRDELTGPAALDRFMRGGVADPDSLAPEVLAAVRAPFADEDSRRALAAAVLGLDRAGFAAVAQGLPALRVPVRVVYGERDRSLTDVADTFARLRRDIPHAEVTALPAAGHFVQEDAPDEVGELLATFFAG